MNSAEEEEVWCECSDDETYNPCKLKKGTWEPTAEDMLKVFEELKTKKVKLHVSELQIREREMAFYMH